MMVKRALVVPTRPRLAALLASCVLVAALVPRGVAAAAAETEPTCPNGGTVVTANVVALDQPIVYNRLGANLPNGMIFALQRDVCPTGQATCPGATLAQLKAAVQPGQPGVSLREGKRPRPLVLRVNEGQCLAVTFTNLLAPPTSSACLPATDPVCAANNAPCCPGLPGAAPASCPNPATSSGGTAGQCQVQPLTTQTRAASVHVQGLEWVRDSLDDGSWVGRNPSSLVAPGDTKVYTLFAAREGAYVLYSTGDTFSGAPDGGQLEQGLFGAVHVEPATAEWYRSQVTEQDLCLASADGVYAPAAGCTRTSPDQLPVIKYQATYPAGHPRAGLPILNMRCPAGSTACVPGEVVHSDLTAVITGPNAGRFKPEDPEPPVFNPAYVLPDRLQPYREFTIVYHEVFQANQAFAEVYNDVLNFDGDGADNFGFNYGMGGIASEIVANRLGVGPMGDCPSCKYEEFFLASWAVGDPAMVVDVPANDACTSQGHCSNASTTTCSPGFPNNCPTTNGTQGQCLVTTTCDPKVKATKAFFPDDPSNVYHSYISDHTKFRILHGGQDLHHLHHQHAHQWLHSPDTSNGDYTDSQSIGPGSSFTLEMVYNGSGNVNQTVGDSIFHCHFYPHFAGGMWSLWRVHDVLETGTRLDADGRPVTSHLPGTGALVTTARALPDGEITTGTPIPALVPLPTIPMAPVPGKVWLTDGGTRISVCGTDAQGTTRCVPNTLAGDPQAGEGFKNPGYPFFIPGLGGQRAPHPPMDFAYACSDNHQACRPAFGGTPADLSACGPGATCVPLDGGLPRHLIAACPAGQTCAETPELNFWDFSKTLTKVGAFRLPEEGTLAEKVAMAAHAQRFHASRTPDGSDRTWDQHSGTYRPADFILNGLPPIAGAPYADPCIAFSLRGGVPPGLKTRHYKAADIQLDAAFNKEGWHFPQQRMLALWGDVVATLDGERAPEPLFFRANSGECIEYVLANLVPNVYELDDFQVRTPTDILGQHIHLVKFDVTSSDGATNGFNYEDGTFSPDEVSERIRAINAGGGLAAGSAGGAPTPLTARTLPFFGPGPGGRWVGAQATVQRFFADPLFDGPTSDPPAPGAQDRTLRTVFTHDHFGPSTHQQAGLYAGLVVEPAGSTWYSNEGTGGQPFGGEGVPSRRVTGPGGATVADGGPTSWQAVIETPQPGDSFREFLFALQDTNLSYLKFANLPSTSFGGFCGDDPKRTCTPATLTTPASGCAPEVVCYAYGFCSDNLGAKCHPATWTTPENTKDCKDPATATCNLVPGVPGQIVAGYPFNTQSPIVATNVATWGTRPIDIPGKKGPEIISLSGGTASFSMNYRNEPLFPRIIDPVTQQPFTDAKGDLAFAYASIPRPQLPASGPYPPLTPDVGPNDPFTPLLRAYAGDDVQVRTLVGAHINPHNFTIHGLKWLMEPSMVDSGWRNSQVMGISEHFEQLIELPTWVGGEGKTADYLYMGGAAAVEQAAGNWGLLRAYGTTRSDLRALPQNQTPSGADLPVCPTLLEPPFTTRVYEVVALTARQALNGALVYDSRSNLITDPNAILYFKLEDLDCPAGQSYTSCKAKSSSPAPLVLRANAGDCIKVTLYNAVSGSLGTGSTAANLPPSTLTTSLLAGAPVPACGATGQPSCLPSNVSTSVGLHPQLVSFDVTTSSGFNAGTNPPQTVPAFDGTKPACGDSRVYCATYKWYAGNVDPKAANPWIPVELGAANLLPADVVNHYQHGLFGGLIVEPLGATWDPVAGTSAVIRTADGSTFREFVLFTQDGLQNPPSPPSLLGDGLNAVNYKAEMLATAGGAPMRSCATAGDVSCVLSSTESRCCTSVSSTTGLCTAWTACGEPQTPIFKACAGEPVRFRLLHPGGVNTDQVFELYGHVWAETPYVSVADNGGCVPPTTHTNLYSSSIIDDDHRCIGPFAYGQFRDSLTDWQGSRMGHGPGNHGDILVTAGGARGVSGDYLYRTYPAMHFGLGLWGIFRVEQCQQTSELPAQAAGGASGR